MNTDIVRLSVAPALISGELIGSAPTTVVSHDKVVALMVHMIAPGINTAKVIELADDKVAIWYEYNILHTLSGLRLPIDGAEESDAGWLYTIKVSRDDRESMGLTQIVNIIYAMCVVHPELCSPAVAKMVAKEFAKSGGVVPRVAVD